MQDLEGAQITHVETRHYTNGGFIYIDTLDKRRAYIEWKDNTVIAHYYFSTEHIQSEYETDGLYYIQLEIGWTFPKGGHFIYEYSRADAYRKMKEVIPCNCSNCQSIIKAKKEALKS